MAGAVPIQLYDEPLWFTGYSVVAYLVLWSGIYHLLCHLIPTRVPEWHCRVVTTAHAVMVTTLSLYSAFIQGPLPFVEPGGTTPLQQVIIKVCLGYFIFDISWCLHHGTEAPVMLVHHFLSLVGLTWAAVSGRYGTELVATIGGTEMTNPLLQTRYFLKSAGMYRDTLIGDVIDVIFAISFGLCRIGLGGSLLWTYYANPTTDFWGRLGGTTIFILGCVFYYYILTFMVSKYRRRTKRRTAERNAEKEQFGGKDEAALSDSVCSNGHTVTSESVNRNIQSQPNGLRKRQ